MVFFRRGPIAFLRRSALRVAMVWFWLMPVVRFWLTTLMRLWLTALRRVAIRLGPAVRKRGPAARKPEPAAPSSRTARDQRGADRMPAAAHDLDRAQNRKMDRSVRSAVRVRRADRRPADFRRQRTAGDTDHWAGNFWNDCRPACPFFTTLEFGSALVARIAVSIPTRVTTARRPFTSFPLARPRQAWTIRRPARSRRPAPGPAAPRSVLDYLL